MIYLKIYLNKHIHTHTYIYIYINISKLSKNVAPFLLIVIVRLISIQMYKYTDVIQDTEKLGW